MKKEYADSFNEVNLSVVFTDPDGEEKLVCSFWAGGNVWRVRYASHKVGRHYFRTVCSEKSNTDIHGQEGILEVIPYHGENPLFKHGPLSVSQTRRHLEHINGTPFFWLADTWWMGLAKRLEWPEGFKLLAADRVEKGFTLIQILAGLPCGMFDGFNPLQIVQIQRGGLSIYGALAGGGVDSSFLTPFLKKKVIKWLVCWYG